MIIRRGEIFLASPDPTVGREISKTRPVVVVSNNKNNRYSGTVTILPITSRAVQKTYPFEVYLDAGKGGLPKKSKIKADQIRTLDKRRLIKSIGVLPEDDMLCVHKAIQIHLDLL